MVYLHNGILCSREKEGAYTLCNSMDGTGEHYAKWNKPGSKGQIPYDLTFTCYIITRRKKQTKYNQRHWGSEQSSSGQGGVGWGQWEEGIVGTTIKDTWTKSRVRVEVEEGGGFCSGVVEGWGKRAYNCNRITIKILKKGRKRKRVDNHLEIHLVGLISPVPFMSIL